MSAINLTMKNFLATRVLSVVATVLLFTLAFAEGAAANFNDINADTQARLIGGFMPSAEQAAIPDVQTIVQSTQWKNARSMAQVLAKNPGLFTKQNQKVMKDFFAQKLGPAHLDTKNSLYLFGGSDVLYPALAFPNLERLVLVGLEKPVALLDPVALANAGKLLEKMGQVAFAFSDILNFSFFLTNHMSKDLQTFGTSTMISVGLVAGGNTLTQVSEISLDRTGAVRNDNDGAVKGLRIQYVKPNCRSADVLYFSLDLSDQSLRHRPEFAAFVKTGHFETAFYKAASYLSHSPSFSALNQLVLTNVDHVIENDDGIPFSALRKSQASWSLKLFGLYATPGKLFGSHPQLDLVAAYDQVLCTTANAGDLALWKNLWGSKACHSLPNNFGFSLTTWEGTLPFRYGYTFGPAGGGKAKYSNLLILDRQN